jgi:hypothetical protein
MTKLILVFALLFANPEFTKNETKIEREVKVLEAKLAKILSKQSLTPCQQACKNKLQITLNICNHVPPANKITCQANALAKYNACRAACN